MTPGEDEGLPGNVSKKHIDESDVQPDARLSPRDRRTLRDFVEFAEIGARLVARGRKAYDGDEMLRLAAESVLLRIGEAVARLSDDVTFANPQVQWRPMKRMRNVVAHEYGAIDHNIVWNSLANDLPSEAGEVHRILGS